MTTIIKIELPLRRYPKQAGKFYHLLPFRYRWFGWLISLGGGTVSEFSGSGKKNRTIHLQIFRYHVLTINRNEYHDRSDAERATEYLKKWSECEKELRGLRLLLMGDTANAEVKKVIKESLGVDLDEGRIL